jgi:NAD(P)-dependent dehydrogenase (short-subunit alcohol dehydrogenase family)
VSTILLTGANRGLGLEFTRQYLAEGWTVHACCRDPAGATELRALATADGRLQLHALDVADFAATASLAHSLAGRSIDVLLANAGLFGPKHGADGDWRQVFGHIDYGVWDEIFRVNTQAPLRLAEAFVEHVAASNGRKIVAISSSLGAIAETGGGLYAYRSNKGALMMEMASRAKDLAPRGIAVGVYCPGWVQTAMGGPQAPLAPATSIAGLRQRIAELGPATSGEYRRYDGSRIPW